MTPGLDGERGLESSNRSKMDARSDSDPRCDLESAISLYFPSGSPAVKQASGSKLENSDFSQVWGPLGLMWNPRPTPVLSTCPAPLHSNRWGCLCTCPRWASLGGQQQRPQVPGMRGLHCWEGTGSCDSDQAGRVSDSRVISSPT